MLIETKRFFLRELQMSDAEGMFALDSDPEVHTYLGNNPIQTLEEAKKIIISIQKQYDDFGIGRWAIIDKKTHDFVGWTGLKYEQKLREVFNYYDLGYRLRKEYWGKGIATETAEASLAYGFEQLHLSKICAGADKNNKASNRILTKLGLQKKGTFTYESTVCNWYELTKNEWKKIR
ncbi:GNAT family N-acetyltransferase [Flavobacteriaceae bacterium M23B6Z8]